MSVQKERERELRKYLKSNKATIELAYQEQHMVEPMSFKRFLRKYLVAQKLNNMTRYSIDQFLEKSTVYSFFDSAESIIDRLNKQAKKGLEVKSDEVKKPAEDPLKTGRKFGLMDKILSLLKF